MTGHTLAHGYARAAAITRTHAKTFYFCSHLLRRDKRLAAYAVYAFSRMIDDTFDTGPDAGPGAIARWAETIASVYGTAPLKDPVLAAVRSTVHAYAIPSECFHELLRGMEMDLSQTSYRTFGELYRYCYRVAGVIGLVMVRMFGYTHDDALRYAEKMGVAMQMTNILRDIKEDLARGRVYLPEDELDRFGIRRDALSAGTVDGHFTAFMRFQIARTRELYREASRGIPLIADANSRFIAREMGTLYGGILDAIEKNGYDVFTGRVYVPFWRKVALSLSAAVPIEEDS